jgi:hypothetical protein
MTARNLKPAVTVRQIRYEEPHPKVEAGVRGVAGVAQNTTFPKSNRNQFQFSEHHPLSIIL